MKLIKFLFFLLLLITCGNSYSQVNDSLVREYSKSNYEIFSSLLDKSLEKIENKISVYGIDKIYNVSISGKKKEETDFFKNYFRQKFSGYRIVYDETREKADYFINIKEPRFNVDYIKIKGFILGNKKVIRKLIFSAEFDISDTAKTNTSKGNRIKQISEDEFYLEEQIQVESGGYDFLKGVLPEKSFIEKMIVPGLIITASAVTIILFFTVRSK